MCRKKCPSCNSPLSTKDIMKTAFAVNAHEVLCSNCRTKINIEWSKAMGFMMLPVLLIMVTLFKDLENNFIRDLLIAFFIYIPLGAILGICFVPVKVLNKKEK